MSISNEREHQTLVSLFQDIADAIREKNLEMVPFESIEINKNGIFNINKYKKANVVIQRYNNDYEVHSL